MADISDVENVLVTTIAGILYPTGTSNPSVLAVDCRVYRGWPQREQLDVDLAAGKVNVSVFPTDVERRTTKYLTRDYVSNLPATTLTATVSATAATVTIAGTIATPQNVAVLAGGLSAVYAVQAGDTLTSIATGLAALLTTAGVTTSSSGAVVTISGVPLTQIVARVGTIASVVQETRRQKRNVMVTLWCPTPGLRDSAAQAIDPVFAGIDFITLPDGTAGRLLYERSSIKDALQKEILYRRDLVYSVEYGTTIGTSAAQVLIQRMTMTGGNDPIQPNDLPTRFIILTKELQNAYFTSGFFEHDSAARS